MIDEFTEDLITYIHLQKIMRQRSNTRLCFVQCRQCNAASQLPPAKTFNLSEGLRNIHVYIIEKNRLFRPFTTHENLRGRSTRQHYSRSCKGRVIPEIPNMFRGDIFL